MKIIIGVISTIVIRLGREYNEGEIRLSGGITNKEGRVEVYHDSHWWTICDADWSDTNANVNI